MVKLFSELWMAQGVTTSASDWTAFRGWPQTVMVETGRSIAWAHEHARAYTPNTNSLGNLSLVDGPDLEAQRLYDVAAELSSMHLGKKTAEAERGSACSSRRRREDKRKETASLKKRTRQTMDGFDRLPRHVPGNINIVAGHTWVTSAAACSCAILLPFPTAAWAPPLPRSAALWTILSYIM